ncbi:TPA: hypothetical protein SMU09_002384 [Proteus mirabilis]|nr:hypothetical protein [Proteus mirabilis]HEK1960680.1 hypothetical protein [Proteus mirabilis]HEK2985972.1 hypothetical protein [Proteus mirabilis]HEK3025818.1 hypothetical protein [Proteus mirabilis]HEK3181110.1 hypothetical protein [Proteus mirabilis]
MTGEVNEKYLTPQERKARQMVKAVNEASPRNLPADAVVCPCENEHRPVYPVRYAYTNFYCDLHFSTIEQAPNKTLEASIPPSINQLLNAKDVTASKGFSARLLRQGWVYVFEEGNYPTRSNSSNKSYQEQNVDATKGRLLVFQHQVTTSDGNENFIPYIFKQLKNGGVTLKKNGNSNPYLAIPKDVKEATILFSESKLSDYTLKKIISSSKFRSKLMQKINFIDYNNNDYCIELNKDNLNRLVEDYKEEVDKFKLFVKEFTHSNIPSSFFSDTTKIPDLPQDATVLINQINSVLDYNEKATLLILKDPVGYQKDVLSYYNIVTKLYLLYQNYYSHPDKIGQFITSIQEASHHIKDTDEKEKMQTILKESINQNALDNEWKNIHKTFIFFEKHQRIVLSLYESFMNNPAIINENGGLKHYFDYAFSYHERITNEDVFSIDFFKDLNQAFDLYFDLISPLMNSTEGQRTLDKLYSINDEENNSLWVGVTKKVISLVANSKIMDALLNAQEYAENIENFVNKLAFICSDSIGFAFTKTSKMLSHYDIKNRLINTKGIDYLAQKILPMILAFCNTKISLTEFVKLSGNELNQWVEQLRKLTEQIVPNLQHPKLNKLFSWKQKIINLGEETAVLIPKIEITDITKNKIYIYGKDALQVSTKLFLNGFSMITGSIQAYTLQGMSLYERNDPLKLSPYNLYTAQIIANLFVASYSILKVSQEATKLSQTVSSTTLKFFLDKIKLPMLTTEVGTKRMAALGKIAGGVGVLLALRDMSEAFHIGNRAQGMSNLVIALGSIILIWATGGWALFAGALILGGVISSQLTSWSHLETLLKHSFWGNEESSNFWNNNRPIPISKQLKHYIDNFDAYQKQGLIELQEFYNLFYTAKMTQEKIPNGKLRLSFEFTNFIPGISEVYFHFVTEVGYHSGLAEEIKTPSSAYVLNKRKDLLEISEQLKMASEKGDWNPETGIFKFSLEVQSQLVNTYSAFGAHPNSRIGIEDLYWYYQVNPEVTTPMRYINWGGDTQENNRLLGFINSENI